MMDENKPWSIRNKEIKAYVKKIGNENRHLKGITQVLLKICKEHEHYPKLNQENKELKNTIELLRQSGSPPDFSNEIVSNCVYYLTPNRCLQFWERKGQVKEVEPEVCAKCWELKQKDKIDEAQSPKQVESPRTRLVPKKPQKIYCIQDGLWLELLKCQAKCRKCQLQSFNTWTRCQEKYREQISQI